MADTAQNQQPAKAEKTPEKETYTKDEVMALLGRQSEAQAAQAQEHIAAAIQAVVAANPHIRPPAGVAREREATTHKEPGDIKVRVVKNMDRSTIGKRVYDSPAGKEMWMSPAHAYELTTGVHEKDPHVMLYK